MASTTEKSMQVATSHPSTRRLFSRLAAPFVNLAHRIRNAELKPGAPMSQALFIEGLRVTSDNGPVPNDIPIPASALALRPETRLERRSEDTKPFHEVESIDAGFLSCTPIEGGVALKFEGRKPLGIAVPNESAFEIRETVGYRDPRHLVTINPVRIEDEISLFCVGRDISMISATWTGSAARLSIFAKNADMIMIASDKPIAFCKVPAS